MENVPDNPERKSHRRRVLLAAAAMVAVCVLAVTWQLLDWRPKRFAEVAPGELYRSGEVSPEQLAHLKESYGISRVICLLNPDAPETQEERAAAEKLGVEWVNVPLPGDGASTPADRARLIELLGMEDAGPTLVHCAAGTNRTGLAVGLYRLHYQGWSLEAVMREMRAFDFEDLPKHENLRAALRAEAESQRHSAHSQVETLPHIGMPRPPEPSTQPAP